jgi:hypothetical protein
MSFFDKTHKDSILVYNNTFTLPAIHMSVNENNKINIEKILELIEKNDNISDLHLS